VSALHNLANALRDLGQFDAAIEKYRAALALKPDHHQCRLGFASVLFYRGDWDEAWRMFEARLDVARIVPPMAFPSQSGDRRHPAHGTGGPQPHSLLVIAEQGHGDTIQFVRYLPELARHGRVALLAAPEMFSLLRTLDAPIELVSRVDGKVQGISGWTP